MEALHFLRTQTPETTGRDRWGGDGGKNSKKWEEDWNMDGPRRKVTCSPPRGRVLDQQSSALLGPSDCNAGNRGKKSKSRANPWEFRKWGLLLRERRHTFPLLHPDLQPGLTRKALFPFPLGTAEQGRSLGTWELSHAQGHGAHGDADRYHLLLPRRESVSLHGLCLSLAKLCSL